MNARQTYVKEKKLMLLVEELARARRREVAAQVRASRIAGRPYARRFWTWLSVWAARRAGRA
jgi:hypothetical protein